jgi:hypothetical protein
MPTNSAKARILLKENKAIVKSAKPFTIQLTYKTNTEIVQHLTLGIDSGYLNIGYSVISNKYELIKGEVKLLKGISERIEEKARYRRIRRQRLRYRKARWNNRNIPQGWLAPSITHKMDSHLKFIEKLYSILPISKINFEVANFDIQKIKNPNIQGEEYQHGEQMGFWNLREYILHRDNHQCQNPNCKNKDKNPILEIHHIVYRSNGGTNSPSNLTTLCSHCHTPINHKGFLKNWKPKIKSFKDATFMSIIRWKMIECLKSKYNINFTYGYITKSNRIKLGLEKTHYNDAFCIAGGTNQKRIEPIMFEQIKRNNRSLETWKDAKYIDIRTKETVSASELNCGRRTRNKNKNTENLRKYRGEKVKNGIRSIRKQHYFYQPNDLVMYKNKIYTVKGTQNNGKYIALKEIKKVPCINLITPYKFRKGICVI